MHLNPPLNRQGKPYVTAPTQLIDMTIEYTPGRKTTCNREPNIHFDHTAPKGWRKWFGTYRIGDKPPVMSDVLHNEIAISWHSDMVWRKRIKAEPGANCDRHAAWLSKMGRLPLPA